MDIKDILTLYDARSPLHYDLSDHSRGQSDFRQIVIADWGDLRLVIKIAHNAFTTPLRVEGWRQTIEAYRSIGCYLAHTLVLYSAFYEIKTLLVLGRVASGDGGDLLISECNRVLAEEYPELASQITVTLPDEKMRRVGQSVAAASLPEL